MLAAVAVAAPRIEVDSRAAMVGEAIEGEQEFVSHTFRLRNSGSDTLRILDVRAGCRCTRTEYDSIIPPGHTGNIIQHVDIKGFTEGPFERTIQVRSNAEHESVLLLRLAGILRSVVEIDKRSFSIPAATRRLAGREAITLRSPLPDVTISDIEFVFEEARSAPWHTSLHLPLQWELTATERSDQDGYRYYELDIWYPDTIAQPISGLCIMRINHPRKPEIRKRGELLPPASPGPAQRRNTSVAPPPPSAGGAVR